MKVVTSLVVWLWFMSTSFAQPPSPPESATWLTHIETARAQASNSGRPILMVFSGSDWCKPCILLRRELFESQDFIAYARDHLILLELDFPSMKKNKLSEEQTKHNEALAERFNPEGAFPLALLIDAGEQVLGSFGYDHTRQPADYLAYLRSLNPDEHP